VNSSSVAARDVATPPRATVAAATAGAILLTAGIAALYETYTGQASGGALAAVIAFYGLTSGLIIAFSVWNARELGMPSLMVLSGRPWGDQVRSLLLYGVGGGLLLAVGSVILSGAGAGQGAPALQPWFWRRIQTPTGVALFAARAAVLEESFFRLFLIPCLVAVVQRTRRPRYQVSMRGGRARIRQEEAAERPAWVVAAAVVASSLMFGLAHPFGPLAAVALGPLLALAYLRGGWESAVSAHFLANWLVFTFYF
jgi:hypothetical protein